MEDPVAVPTDILAPADPAPTYISGPTYTDPISSFFGGIFFIIILFLVIVFVVILMIGRGLGIFKDAPAAPAAKKEKFHGGPPYPHCQTNGAYAMF
jgi:hypothetical protein